MKEVLISCLNLHIFWRFYFVFSSFNDHFEKHSKERFIRYPRYPRYQGIREVGARFGYLMKHCSLCWIYYTHVFDILYTYVFDTIRV